MHDICMPMRVHSLWMWQALCLWYAHIHLHVQICANCMYMHIYARYIHMYALVYLLAVVGVHISGASACPLIPLDLFSQLLLLLGKLCACTSLSMHTHVYILLSCVCIHFCVGFLSQQNTNGCFKACLLFHDCAHCAWTDACMRVWMDAYPALFSLLIVLEESVLAKAVQLAPLRPLGGISNLEVTGHKTCVRAYTRTYACFP